MRAGRLDRRIEILRQQETGRNEVNEPIMGWVAIAEVWASARPNRGAERFEAQQLVGSAVMTFQIRYRGDVGIEDRIGFKGRTWDIHDVREIGREVGTEIDATARAD